MTIFDVAALAAVSVATVSKALNGRGQLRPETVERVRIASRELGFQPNELAKSLTRGRTFTVGLLTSDSFGRFSIPLTAGIEDALGAGQISVFLCDARGDRVREQHYIRSLLSRKVDGIIVTGRRTDARQPLSEDALPIPVVYAYCRSASPDDLSILPDDHQGAALATRHLVDVGRRRLAHMTGPSRFAAVSERETGMRSVLDDAGVPLPSSLVLAGEWSEAWGREAVRILLTREPGIDAIFCGSDLIARGAADELREAGVKVPDDIALVGFDNWEIIAAATRPPLTTVDLDLEGVGNLAAYRLLAMIRGETASGVERHACRLVVRESSGASRFGHWPPPAVPEANP